MTSDGQRRRQTGKRTDSIGNDEADEDYDIYDVAAASMLILRLRPLPQMLDG